MKTFYSFTIYSRKKCNNNITNKIPATIDDAGVYVQIRSALLKTGFTKLSSASE